MGTLVLSVRAKFSLLLYPEDRIVCAVPVAAAFVCPECGDCLSSQDYLDQHVRDSHAERPQGRLQCSFCEYTTNRKSHLLDHEQTHTGDRPFSCPSCHKNFTRKNGLIKHLRVHTGEKPYECTICGRQFKESSVLSRHRKLMHLDAKPYACRYCCQAFSDKSSVTKHLVRCERKFTMAGNAQQHEQQMQYIPNPLVGHDSPEGSEIVLPK